MPTSTPLSPHRRNLVGLVVVLGVVMTAIIWHFAITQESRRIHEGFLSRAHTQANLARERLRSYEDMIYSLHDSFVGRSVPTREEFSYLARALLKRYTGVKALEWVEIVPADQRANFEARISAETGRSFVIRERTPDGDMGPAQSRPAHYVINYVEPIAGNERAFGYDVTTAPTALLLERARIDGLLKVSQPFPLVQSDSHKEGLGIIFILPIHRDRQPDSPVIGFVQGVFHLRTLLAGPHATDTNDALETYYFDVPAGTTAPTLLYANLAGQEPINPALPQLDDPENFTEVLQVGDHHLRMVIHMSEAWANHVSATTPWLILLAGIIITLLLGLWLNSLLQRTSEIETQVRERTDQLHTSETRLQAILGHSPAAIYLKDIEGRFLLCNEPFAKSCRRTVADISGRTWADIFPADVARTYHEHDLAVLKSGQPAVFEESIPGPDRDRFHIVHKFPLLDDQGQIYALCGIATDITERKQADLELQENRRQLNSLISQLPGAAFRCRFDENLTTLYVSEGMLPLTGYPAEDFLAGRIHIAALTVPADREIVQSSISAAIDARCGFEVEYRITPREGNEKWLLVRGRPVYNDHDTLRFIEGLAIDITTLKSAEIEKIAFERNLQQVQKLESLGVMAGGIAHDFNNILAAILGNTNLVRLTLDRADPNQRHLEQVEKATRRAAHLCNQMLAYAGKGSVTVGPLDLTHLVRETTAMLEVSIQKRHELVFNLAEALPAVKGDAAQLGQVVMNFVINASDAIGERGDGRIVITTFQQKTDATLFQYALHKPKLPAGIYVGLEVQDNGCGMTLDTIARIFEPFFTTKFSGRGLGLAAVLGIVQSHQGALFVQSNPGRGSTFRMLLPALPAIKPATPVAPTPARSSAATTLRGTVLIIDDEESVRNMMAHILEYHGAAVLTAADGLKGLELYRQHQGRIDLILLDLTMPGLSGKELIQRLRDESNQQKIVVMSGYSEDETMQQCAALGVVGFLRKPFDLTTALGKLKPHLS